MSVLIGRERESARLHRALADGVDMVVVDGETGVGKTHLVRHVLSEVEGPSGWVTATSAARRVPLGAFADLVGDELGTATERARLLHDVSASLRQRAGDGRLTLVIDDVDLLDDTSAALVSLLAAAPDVALIVTHRAGAPRIDIAELTAAAERTHHIHLSPLNRSATAEVAAAILGVPLSGGSLDAAWDRSQGNPLFLRELLVEAQQRDTVLERDGRAVLQQLPPPSTSLREVVGARFGRLSRPELDILGRLALVEGIGLGLLATDDDARPVEHLEERGLLTVTLEGGRRVAAMAHPMYAEVLRSEMPRTRLERHARELVDALGSTGGRRRDDPLLLAELADTAGRHLDAGHLLEAARRALELFDHERAERFARRARERGGGVVADVVLGEALTNLGRADEADEVLAEVGWDADDSIVARAVLTRARNSIFASGDATAAQELVERALGTVTAPAWRDELEATLALCLGVSGDFDAASAAGRRVLSRPDTGGRAALSVFVVSTLADALLGRLDAAERGIDQALPLTADWRESLPFAELQLTVNLLMVHWHRGDLDEAERLGRERLGRSVEAGASDPAALYGLFLAMVVLEQGRCQQALDVCTSALDRAEDRSVFGIASSGLAIEARARAAVGDLPGAKRALDELQGFEGDVRGRIHGARARAWAIAARGALTEAADLAAAEGRWALGTSHVVWGAHTLYDAVRFGRPELVVEDLERVAERVEGGLIPLFRDHGRSLCDGDGDKLDTVAQGLADLGTMGYAAEAAGHAADAHRRHGRARQARRSMTTARLHARTCEGDGFPLIAAPAAEPLTRREEEVARMAATGRTSREIADTLVLSVRTVDNHLSAVYRKTGVDGREELGDLFG